VQNDKGDTMVNYLEPISADMKVQAFKEKFIKDSGKEYLTPSRCAFKVGNPKTGKPIKDRTKTLGHYITEIPGEDGVVVLYFKDMCRQVSWSTVFYVEYAGPIVIAAIILALRLYVQAPEKPLLFNQKLLISLIFAHYIKRELETAFVHRFSNETMPLSSIFINSAHYWVLMGFSTYWLLRPAYVAPTWIADWGFVVFACMMVVFELLNMACHIV